MQGAKSRRPEPRIPCGRGENGATEGVSGDASLSFPGIF